MGKKIKIGTLISGGGTNLQAIIDSCRAGKIDADILFTGSDNPGVKGLERAQKAGIDTFVVDYAKIIESCRNGKTDLPSDFDLEQILEKQQLMGADESRERLS